MHPEIPCRHGNPFRTLAAEVGKVTRRVAATISECQRAQVRMTVLRLSPDRLMADPNAPPDTYAEFLMRTSGPTWPEPGYEMMRREMR